MKIKAVLFDLDGTLLNTLPDLTNISNTTMREAGFPEHTEEEVKMFIGNGMRLLFERSLPKDISLSKEEYDRLYERMRANYLKYQNRLTVCFDGILPLLKALKAEGIKTAIVSNKIDEATKAVAARYFEGLVDFAIGTREELRIKPYPDLGLEALKELCVNAEECVYVGDSDTDIETGNNLGMPTLSVTWGFRSEEFLKEHGARYLVHTPGEILNFVRNTVL